MRDGSREALTTDLECRKFVGRLTGHGGICLGSSWIFNHIPFWNAYRIPLSGSNFAFRAHVVTSSDVLTDG